MNVKFLRFLTLSLVILSASSNVWSMHQTKDDATSNRISKIDLQIEKRHQEIDALESQLNQLKFRKLSQTVLVPTREKLTKKISAKQNTITELNQKRATLESRSSKKPRTQKVKQHVETSVSCSPVISVEAPKETPAPIIRTPSVPTTTTSPVVDPQMSKKLAEVAQCLAGAIEAMMNANATETSAQKTPSALEQIPETNFTDALLVVSQPEDSPFLIVRPPSVPTTTTSPVVDTQTPAPANFDPLPETARSLAHARATVDSLGHIQVLSKFATYACLTILARYPVLILQKLTALLATQIAKHNWKMAIKVAAKITLTLNLPTKFISPTSQLGGLAALSSILYLAVAQTKAAQSVREKAATCLRAGVNGIKNIGHALQKFTTWVKKPKTTTQMPTNQSLSERVGKWFSHKICNICAMNWDNTTL